MEDLVAITIPIFICVVLPVAIVLIVFLSSLGKEKVRAKVLIKAIEANNTIDADKLAEALRKPKKTAREILNKRLLYGCISAALGIALIASSFLPAADVQIRSQLCFAAAICLAFGVGFLAVYFVTRKSVD